MILSKKSKQIQYISDIHLEFPENYKHFVIDQNFKPAGDYLVIAGDIFRVNKFKKAKAKAWFKYCSDNWKHTIVVLGNHDYWDTRLKGIESKWDIFPNVTVLNNDIQDVDDIRFVGTTLWSNVDVPNSMVIYKCMNDFRRIRYKGYGKSHLLTLGQYHHEHINAYNFLDSTLMDKCSVLKKRLKTVVVTHHCPLPQFSGARQGDILSSAYCTDLSKFIFDKDIDAWICGHTHINPKEPFNLEGTIVDSNCYGYPTECRLYGFKSDKTITLK